jgi:uncharacterized hydrophobic protein (TIGR00271 family)
MSILFAASSQSEINRGLPWVDQFCQTSALTAELVIVGEDRASLLAYAKEITQKHDFILTTSAIAADPKALSDYSRTSRPSLVVMCSDEDDDKFQQSCFRASPSPAMWLKTLSAPPILAEHVFSVDPMNQADASAVCNRWLGIGASLNLLTDTESAGLGSDSRSWTSTALDAAKKRSETGDLICIDCSSQNRIVLLDVGMALVTKPHEASVMLYHSGETKIDTLAGRFRHLAARVAEPMDREQRIELSQTLSEGSQPNLEFLGLISASSMLAAFGLLQDSAAVIIGAMLIAPLMTPILGAGLSLAHGNRPLFKSSLATIGLGFLGALGSSFLFGMLVRLTQGVSSTGEMWARCNPTALDFCVGLVGGIAASYARTRRHLSSALAGAAIAAALVPPISTAGLHLAFGMMGALPDGRPVAGPLLLVTINVLTIMVGSSLVLYLRGLHGDQTTLRKDRWGLRVLVMLIVLACLVLAAMI